MDVSCNDIKSLFGGNPGYTAYPNLTVFVALNNDISNFVGLSQNCPCLKVLDLRNNDLTQNVFDELSSMHNLTHVNLCNNDIKSTEGDKTYINRRRRRDKKKEKLSREKKEKQGPGKNLVELKR